MRSMILVRFTRRTLLNSASLGLCVLLVLSLATMLAFKTFTKGNTKHTPKTPNQRVSKSDGVQDGEKVKKSQPRELEIPSFGRDDSAPSAGSRRKLAINGVEFVFCWIPEGTFMMGSPFAETDRADNEIHHEVRISQGFWMLETEVTQEEWKPFIGDNPSRFEYSERLPVENVSWNDCQRYVDKLNALGLCPPGLKFALPTEAQWEYACRAGTTTPYSFGESLNNSNANCNGSLGYGATKPVKSYLSNPWGLYDMHGNVAEWTADWYANYSRYRATDPKGAEQGIKRVYRGGSWIDPAWYCRSASRFSAEVDAHADGVGFRLILVKTNNKNVRPTIKNNDGSTFPDNPSQKSTNP